MQRRTFLKSLALSPLVSSIWTRPLYAQSNHYDVIVIGAGLAGLNAAKQCESYGMNVLVLEASSRVGGRIKSLDQFAGIPEVGGMQIGKGYGLTRHLAHQSELELAAPLQFARGQTLAINQQLLTADTWANSDANKLANHETKITPARLLSHYLSKSPVFAADQWQTDALTYLDIPLQDYLKQKGASEEAIRLIGHNFNGEALSQHSALDSLKALMSRKGTPPGFDMVIGGNQLLPQAMASNLASPIHMQHPVSSISTINSNYRVQCENNAVFTAKHIVAALPFSVLKHINLDVELSKAKRSAIDNLGYTPVTQVILKVEQPFWEEDKLSANLWSDSPIERIFALKNERKQITTLICWLNGQNALAVDKLSEADTQKYILGELARVRPSTKGKVSFSYRQSWQNNPYQRGAYAYYRAGSIAAIAPFVSNQEGNIHFAGEHTQPLLPGMEAALYSGMRVADEIKRQI